MEHEEILHRCFRCGYCKLPANYVDINCPSYLAFRFETYAPGGRMWLLRGWLDGRLAPSDGLADILFSCAACGNCTTHCAFPEFKELLLEAFTAGREKLLDAGRVPPKVRDYLTRLQNHGNPWGLAAGKRGLWADGLDLPAYAGQEYLFLADDVGSYDPRGKEIARSVAKLLQFAGVDFGVLADGLVSDGNDVRIMGEIPLFEELARRNIDTLNQAGVGKIITLSPHTFHALKNAYPGMGGQYQVFHYTQPLAFAAGRLQFAPDAPQLRVAFHDPCYLGRHNGDYESPRMILRAVPGVRLVEMDRSRKNALCCGGGGGNFFTDMLSGGDDAPAMVRVREAADAGADVLAVACPQCAIMLADAAKSAGLEDTFQVMEISELVNTRLART